MRAWVARHPFLLLGLSSPALFALATRLDAGVPFARLLIVPWYVMWLLVTIAQVRLLGPDAGAASALDSLFLAAKIAAGLLPYLAADALLARAARRQQRRDPAT